MASKKVMELADEIDAMVSCNKWIKVEIQRLIDDAVGPLVDELHRHSVRVQLFGVPKGENLRRCHECEGPVDAHRTGCRIHKLIAEWTRGE